MQAGDAPQAGVIIVVIKIEPDFRRRQQAGRRWPSGRSFAERAQIHNLGDNHGTLRDKKRPKMAVIYRIAAKEEKAN
mgnify:CR=1 FL=1